MITKNKFAIAVAVLAAMVLLYVPKATADTFTDPAVLFITSTGDFCQSTGACVYNNEANPLAPTTLSIFENGNGQPAMQNPLLLILGIPNTTAGAPAGVALSNGTGAKGGADSYGGDWDPVTGFAPSHFQASSTQDVYAFLGMVEGNGSESFTNWSGADASIGVSVTSGYGIAVYELKNTGLTGGGSVSVTFSGPLPLGSVVVAYGCSVTETGNNLCSAPQNPYTTPFTQAGVSTSQQSAPEPSTLFLLGFGLVGLVGLPLLRRCGSSFYPLA